MLTHDQLRALFQDLFLGWEVELLGPLGWVPCRLNPKAGFFEIEQQGRWHACPIAGPDLRDWRRRDMGQGKVG